ncbi:MAG: hypothetical protein HY553_07415 [Elusimicrobia bacterium]|nr:hypothetical protein [Elusimicrobiota bacterium]
MTRPFPLTIVVCLLAALPAAASHSRNGAVVVSQSAPSARLTAGQTVQVSITLRNSGTKTWTRAGGYKLGAQSPADSPAFRVGRVPLPVESVAPGRTVTFTFPVNAPVRPGSYDFQWRMVQERKEWFGQLTPKVQVAVSPRARRGKVRLDGWQAVDDDGPFNAVGFTLMSALRLYRNPQTRAQLDKDLDEAAAAGYHFARILGEVGWDDGKEISPNWPDYDQNLVAYVRHAYSKGIRTQLCIFGGGSPASASPSTRAAFVDRVTRLLAPQQEAVFAMQVQNEPGVAGQFDDPAESAGHARRIAAAMPGAIVMMGAPFDKGEEFARYGFPLSPHLDRGTTGTLWRPVRQPWDYSELGKPWMNDEPVGPGSSIYSETDCVRQKALHMMTFIGKGFATVFHSSPGVGYRLRPGFTSPQVSDAPCFKDIPAAVGLLPFQLPQYTRKNGHWRDSPFENLDAFDLQENTGRGVNRAYSGIRGDDFATITLNQPVGVRFRCRTISGPVSVYKLETLQVSETVQCAPGTEFELGPGPRLLRRPRLQGVASPN